jgi:hypothetical protein
MARTESKGSKVNDKDDDSLDYQFSWKNPFDAMWYVFKWLLVVYLIADFKALMS